MTYRQPLTPVPYAKRTDPTKSLAEGAAYTPACATNIRYLFCRIRQEQQGKAMAGRG